MSPGLSAYGSSVPVAKKRLPSPGLRVQSLLALLADGKPHSGSGLARTLRISRSAIWKLVGALRDLGVPVESLPRVGYRLPRPVDLLDASVMLAELDRRHILVESFDVPLTTPSTNQHLADLDAPSPGAMRVCATEVQSAGRGRRGRTWSAPFGSGICLSVSWQFAEPPPDFSALGLVVGVAVARSLTALGFADVQLKWPNDLVWHHRKLGGILIEMRGEAGGPANVVIGMGINVRMPADARLELAKQNAVVLADLHEMTDRTLPPRNDVIVAVLTELAKVLPVFSQQGLAPFRGDWERFDAIANSAIKVFTQAAPVVGQARGISNDGALLVVVDGRLHEFVSGEVSVRTAPLAKG